VLQREMHERPCRDDRAGGALPRSRERTLGIRHRIGDAACGL
jgi:hypothetical protein